MIFDGKTDHSVKRFTGKNTDFVADWSCALQTYTIYYKGSYFATKYRFSDVEAYLN